AMPVQRFAIQHDRSGELVLDFQHANGRHRVTFPQPGRLRVEITRNSLSDYLAALHTASAAFRIGDWRIQCWSYYNEFAMWSLMAMMATGVYLWLSRRARYRWAMASLAAGVSVFAGLWVWTR